MPAEPTRLQALTVSLAADVPLKLAGPDAVNGIRALARLFNGGPEWRSKNETVAYWLDVKDAILAKLDGDKP